MDLQQEGAEDVLMDGGDAGDQRGLESPLHFREILAPLKAKADREELLRPKKIETLARGRRSSTKSTSIFKNPGVLSIS